MTRFYFDINDGEASMPDHSGILLKDRDEARREALAVLAPVASEGLPDCLSGPVSVTVRDSEKRPIFHASLTLVEDWIG